MGVACGWLAEVSAEWHCCFQLCRWFPRAVGSVLGMAIADAVGAPLEFLDVTDTRHKNYHCKLQPKRAPQYGGMFNKFMLKPGQFTDDASMGLCMADSLLARRGYDGCETLCSPGLLVRLLAIPMLMLPGGRQVRYSHSFPQLVEPGLQQCFPQGGEPVALGRPRREHIAVHSLVPRGLHAHADL